MVAAAMDALEAVYLRAHPRKLKIVNYRRRAGCLVALQATYGALNRKTITMIARRVRQFRVLFVNRLWALGKEGEYFAVSGVDTSPEFFDVRRVVQAFQRCVRCVPNLVIYAAWRQKQKRRPCRRSNFCPACWARGVVRAYRGYKQTINILLAAKPAKPVKVTLRVYERFVEAPFADLAESATPEELTTAISIVRAHIADCKQYLSAMRKNTYRNTAASYWRIVAIPDETGWRIQLRQLLITTPKRKKKQSKKPRHEFLENYSLIASRTVTALPRKTWLERKTTESFDDGLAELMVEFSAYPRTLLTADIDLVAACLNAARGQKMAGATGQRLAAVGIRERIAV